MAERMRAVDEAWRPVPGYDGAYEVSSLGRVRTYKRTNSWSSTPKILDPYVTAQGYRRLPLRKDGRSRMVFVHRLVAEVFIGPPTADSVNHIDGDKLNNAVANLEYATRAENVAHSWRIGLTPRGARRGSAKLTDEKVAEIRARRAAVTDNVRCGGRRHPLSTRSLAAEYGVSPGVMFKILARQTWTHVP